LIGILVSASLFEQFRKNLAVKNAEEISGRYLSITKRLNKDYWDTDSDYQHCLQVGSYGRRTAIHGVSDLDMAFELPWSVHDRICKLQGNRQKALLEEVRDKLKVLYPNTPIRADGQVVTVDFKNYRVEVLPAFVEDDGRYKYPDANDGGSWKWCHPRDEIEAVQEIHDRSNRNLKRVCKMIRAWKNKHGAAMSGMLIDTLCYNFFYDNKNYDNKSYASYPALIKDIFTYLSEQPSQTYWKAPGSDDRVHSSGRFQAKAKKAAKRAQEALDAEEEKDKQKVWKKIFGRHFPAIATAAASASVTKAAAIRSTEEFVEDKYPVDIQYEVNLECDVLYRGARERVYRFIEATFPWLQLDRKLTFRVVDCNVPRPYEVIWKVRNRGQFAEARGIRGQLLSDDGSERRTETTSFPGRHYVECYVIKNGVCVARDRLIVPISET
jgi:hypothetical protein